MNRFFGLFGLVILLGLPVNGSNDMTTVYRIDRIKSDRNEVKYVNMCTVSVRVQPQQEQFPLFSINDNSSILDWRQIPPLYSGHPSNWSVVLNDQVPDIIKPLTPRTEFYVPPVHTNFVNPLLSIDPKLVLLKGHNYLKFFFQNPDPDNIRYLENRMDKDMFKYMFQLRNVTIYNEDEMARLYNETHHGDLFSLQVMDVKSCFRETSYSAKLYWNPTDFIDIIIDQTNNITVCTVANKTRQCDQFHFLFNEMLIYSYCHFTSWYSVLIEEDEVNIYNYMKTGDVQVIRTNHRRPKGVHTYTRVTHDYLNAPKDLIMNYDVVEIQPLPLHSPWFKITENTWVYILYFTKPGHKLNVSVEEENTGNTTRLGYHELDRANYTDRIERVLIRVPVEVLHSGTGNQRIMINQDKDVFIGNIWERTNLDRNKEKALLVCDKSNITDIYNTVERTSTESMKESSCTNGGRLEEGTCVCPAGFAGNQCQRSCGRNHFGENCSFVCSNSSNECKGMILCTAYYGCTCAPGYYGHECNLQCKEGFYGADCKQPCEQCPYGCNKYTGACRDNCSKPELRSPSCYKNSFYLKDAPEIVESNFTSVTIQVNFAPSQIIVGSLKRDKPSLYTVQYREDLSPTWNSGPYEAFHPVMSNITVNDLKPGRLYELRVVLIDYSQEIEDTLRSKISRAQTNCTPSLRKQNLRVSSISFRAIGLTWDKELDLEEMVCPSIHYLLEIDEMTETDDEKSKQLVQVKGNSYSIENLDPGKTYSITLKRVTIFGESEPIASKNVTTDDTKLTAYKTTSNRIGLRWIMPNINLTKIRINIELVDLSEKIWNKTIDMVVTLHSYQCKPWPDFSCYDVTELVTDTKYNITVKLSSVDSTRDIFSKSIVAETKETSPSSVRDLKLKLISDTSLSLSWRIPFQLNGILTKFIIELEHVSSFGEEMCCESSIVEYLVSAEVEIYSHVLQDIKPASSYQITIRPLTKGLGPKVSQTIETPPPRVPFQRQVVYNNQTLQLHLQHMETTNEEYNTLVRETLVIVSPNQPVHTNPLLETQTLDGFQHEMSEILGNNNWWLTHVCAAADETCTIDLTRQTESTNILPYYGKLERKPLHSGNQYRIVLTQVNQYQSARSYTVEYYSLSM